MISYGIIGLGRLGGTLAQALNPLWCMTHSQAKAEEFQQQCDGVNVRSSIEALDVLPDCILITVPDGQIESVAQSVARHFGKRLEGKMVLHCSGALGVELLDSCRTQGAHAASAHPFQTFTTASPDALQGIAWGIDCMPEDEEFLGDMIHSLDGNPVILTDETRNKKAIYHATAVVASNFLTMLIATAREFAAVAGIDERLFLAPIIRQTIENSLFTLGTNAPPPLTGPIARGDSTTVRIHRDALAQHPDLLRMYSLLSKATLEVACANKLLTTAQITELESALSGRSETANDVN